MPRIVVLAVLAAVALGAVVVVARMRAPAPVPIAVVVEDLATATPQPIVVVDVAGAVTKPGIVRLPYGTRVGDAIAGAGGLAPDADLSALNRAALLRDGARVYVPRIGETPPAGSLGSPAETKIDLNHATASELETLPGIGPATSMRIIRSREQQAFARLEDLQTRGLVSARVLADIRDLLTLR
ncbi:MAG TPA: ComEA family DNA-binding protein [Candidatus Limnocylindrales bacterium]|nr:ComEA family DNA-binding protein [Candidatus Limnocylindrales bacterium]